MRKLLLLLVALGIVAAGTAYAEPVIVGDLDSPESAAWDPATERWYVGNRAGNAPGDGFISRISTDGTLERDWVTGLNSPFGVAVRGSTLYTADGNRLVAIDIPSKSIAWIAPLPASGANDVATDPDSEDVYVSNHGGNAIYRVSMVDGAPVAEIFLSGAALDAPNGLFVESGTLYIANMALSGTARGQLGRIKKVSLSDNTKTLTDVTGGIGFLDGIIKDGDTFYVTDVLTSRFIRVGADGVPVVLGAAPLAADLGADLSRHVFGIPTVDGVVFYDL